MDITMNAADSTPIFEHEKVETGSTTGTPKQSHNLHPVIFRLAQIQLETGMTNRALNAVLHLIKVYLLLFLFSLFSLLFFY